MIIKNRTTKEEVKEMPKVEYSGEIYIINTPEQADRAIRYLSQFPMLGIDTETRPSFKKGEWHKVGLLQVATENRCYLFRLCKFGLTLPLIQLMENPNITKVGVSLKDDFRMLSLWSPLEPKNAIELQDLVQELGITDKSLQKIYGNLFGMKVSKAQRLSNWEADELSIAQQQYAAIDAWACLQIYHKVEELKETGDYELVIVPEPEEETIEEPTNTTI
jgi:ribonuclease D